MTKTDTVCSTAMSGSSPASAVGTPGTATSAGVAPVTGAAARLRRH